MSAKDHFPHLLEVLPEDGDATISTLELLWRAAPEQVGELDAVFSSGIQARLSRGKSPTLGVTFNALQIPKEFLEQLWLLSHAAWNDLLQFDKLKRDPKAFVENSLVAKAVEAARMLAKGERPGWPSEIPAFQEEKPGVEAKAVRELFAMAAAWAILHEVQHAKFFEDQNRPKNIVDEEMACDAYASDVLLSKIQKYHELTGEEIDRVRGKRAMSSLVGLYYVARLSAESRSNSDHPPVQCRIKLLFDKIGADPASYFWTFALALVWGLNPSIATMPVSLPDPSQRDLAYCALAGAFT